MMHGCGKSDFAIVAEKPANCGVGGAKGGDQGKCKPAKHAPDSEPGKRVTGAGAHAASICRLDPR